MRFTHSKVFKNGSSTIIKITAELRNALMRKTPSDKRLIKFAISNDVQDMPTSKEVRQMAFLLLFERGYRFTNE